MDVTSYFESLGLELRSLQQRVRQLIVDAHWQTDGEWKESVLRQVLRRHLPSTAVVGRGFVLTKGATTSQIDILVRDSSKPVIFSDGDLAFVTPDAVLGIIEVKSRVNTSQFRAAATKLAADIALIRQHPNSSAFSALFSYDSDGDRSEPLLDALAESSSAYNQRLDFAAVGDAIFLKYWHLDPKAGNRIYERWHSYRLPSLAPGYFVHSVVDAICPDSVLPNNEIWFPDVGKEQFYDASRSAAWATSPARGSRRVTSAPSRRPERRS